MKNRKLIAILLAFVLIFTQFSMFGIVSAETPALTGREGFLKGITIQTSKISSDAYTKAYDAVLDAAALGANLIRHKIVFDNDNLSYDIGRIDLAKRYGMEVMAIAPIAHYDSENKCILPADQIDIEGIAEKFEAMATTLQGKVAYYQLDNELNAKVRLNSDKTNGMDASVFNKDDIESLAVALYAANNAIKAADPNAKTVINFSWQHVGYIDALKAVKIDADTGRVATESSTNITSLNWDVIGLDWYSDGDNSDYKENGYFGNVIDYEYVIEQVIARNPQMDIIVCEANIRPKSEKADGTIEYHDDPSWIADFANYCYNETNNKVIGFFAFELYDEPQFSYDANGENYAFNVESHHGLIDKDGNKKPTYDVVRGLFGGTGVVADRTVSAAPAMNNEGEVKAVFQSETVVASFPRVYSELEVLTVENENGVNFKNGRFIEFDFYVEDVEAYLAAMDRMEMNLDIIVRTNGVDVYRNCRFLPNDYILQNGWNHIKIAIGAFFERSSDTADVDWENINKLILKFNSSNLQNYSELSGMKLAIANVCSTDVAVPKNQVTQNKIVISEEGYEKASDRKTGYFYNEVNFAIDADDSFDSLDLSLCEKLEFDLYVENLEFFKTITESFPLHLRFISDSSGSKHCRYDITEYVTKQGWNHIEIRISDQFNIVSGFNFATIKRWRVYFNGTNGLDMPYPTTYIMFKNFNGVEPEMPAKPENIVVESTNKVIKTYTTNTANINNITKVLDTPLDLSKADYIEFDLYVESVAHFWSYQEKWLNSSSGNHAFVFYLSPSDSTPTNNQAAYVQNADNKQVFYNFVHLKDQITKDGWNHIKLPVTEMRTGAGAGTGENPQFGKPLGQVENYTDYLKSIKRIGWFNARGTNTAAEWYPNERIGFGNVYGTVEDYNLSPELPENVVASSSDRVVKTYRDNTKYINDITSVLETPINLSIADYIEFDIYVENVEHFWNYQAQWQGSTTGNHTFVFYLSPSDETPPTNNKDFIQNTAKKQVFCHFVDIKDQITEDGWNHIKLPVTQMRTGAGESNFGTYLADVDNYRDLLKSIKRVGWFTARGSNTGAEWYITEHIGFANVCGTADIEVPTDVMADKVEFIGATLNQIEFDSEGIYSLEFDAVDISATKMIELDVFVTDSNFTYLDVEFVDGAGNYAVYTFEDLTLGWNHLGKRLTDAIEGEVDFANITGYALYGEAKASVILSNFYAADYVKGDGTRDGKVDIRDLVRSSIVFEGTETKGNIVAMDLIDNDYKVKAEDVSALRKILLGIFN